MGYLEAEDLLGNATFQTKTRMALIKISLDVVGEAGTGTVVNKRHDLGVLILNNPEAYEERFRRAIAAGGLITTAGDTDANYNNAISSVFSDMAGVKNSDT